jgi:phosphatidylglycerol---prolipoprotein diacylglyceryl transferase
MDGRVDLLVTYIIVGGILGGRLGEVFIYEWWYYSQHPGQILATRNGGMSFIGGIVGAIIAVGIFLWIYKPKKMLATSHSQLVTFLTLTDMMAVITPVGIMLGRIGNFLNRELYGPIVYNKDAISSVTTNGLFERRQWVILIEWRLYRIMEKLLLVFDYGTTQMYAGEVRINTNFLASFGEWLLILIILQILFWTRRKKGKMTSGTLTWIFLILYSVVRFLLEYLRIDSLDDYHGMFTSTQRLSFVMIIVGIVLIFHKQLFARKK